MPTSTGWGHAPQPERLRKLVRRLFWVGWTHALPEDSFQNQRCTCNRCGAKTGLGRFTQRPSEPRQCDSVTCLALQLALALDSYSASCASAMSRHW